jgi:hypothetical protein
MKTKFSCACLLGLLAVALLVTPMGAQTRQYRDATSGFLNQTTFVALGAETASGDSGTPVDMGPYSNGVIHINVTAESGTGTPTLTVTFQSCADATITYCSTHTASSGITATGNTILKVSNYGRYVRVIYTISGTTPSFTFQVLGAFKPYGQ